MVAFKLANGLLRKNMSAWYQVHRFDVWAQRLRGDRADPALPSLRRRMGTARWVLGKLSVDFELEFYYIPE